MASPVMTNRGRCKGHCNDYEEARWKIRSRFPALAIKQKKCHLCGYACYIEDFDGSVICPCCKYKFTMPLNRSLRVV